MSLFPAYCTSSKTKLSVTGFYLHTWQPLWKFSYVMTETCRSNFSIWTSVRSWKLIHLFKKKCFILFIYDTCLSFLLSVTIDVRLAGHSWYKQSEVADHSSKNVAGHKSGPTVRQLSAQSLYRFPGLAADIRRIFWSNMQTEMQLTVSYFLLNTAETRPKHTAFDVTKMLERQVYRILTRHRVVWYTNKTATKNLLQF